jgi:glycine cleavage system H protein
VDAEGCPVPDDRRYDVENDVWVRPEEGSDLVTAGMMAHLASFAGKFTALTYRSLEGPQPQGRSVATAESVRFTGAIRLPFAATVVERNPALSARPKLLNDAPYAEGWVVRVRPDDAAAPLRLASAGVARPEVARKVLAMHIHCLPAVPDTEMFEIGAECQAILVRLDEEIAQRAVGDVVHLVTDDPTSPIEMVRWSDRSGYPVLHAWAEGNLRHFLVRRTADPRPRRRVVPVG